MGKTSRQLKEDRLNCLRESLRMELLEQCPAANYLADLTQSIAELEFDLAIPPVDYRMVT